MTWVETLLAIAIVVILFAVLFFAIVGYQAKKSDVMSTTTTSITETYKGGR